MSLQALVWASSLGGALRPAHKAVLSALANFADAEGGSCYPSIGTLAERSCMSARNVQYRLRELQAFGLVTIERGTGRGLTSVYRLHLGASAPERVQSGAPFPKVERVQDSAERVQNPQKRVQSGAPFPKVERVQDSAERVQNPQKRVQSGAPDPLRDPVLDPSKIQIRSIGSEAKAIPAFELEHPEPKRQAPMLFALPGGKASAADLDAEFSEWWAAYPRKTGKGAARDAYAKARRKKGVTAGLLLAGVQKTKFPKDEKYIPMPTTWLNQERWTDKSAAPVSEKAKAAQGAVKEMREFYEKSGYTFAETVSY